MIVVEDLYKSFGRKQVLEGVNLRVPKGETTAIIGGSGSGKSVLIKHIIGLLFPDSGRVLVDGEDLCALGAADLVRVRRRFGMVFQGAALFDSMPVWQNVGFALLQHTGMPPDEVMEVARERLEWVGLSADVLPRMPAELSGGMRKRVGFARAIAMDPEILLYDEPTTGLDPVMSDVINRLVRSLQERLGVTSVLITHDMVSAYHVADHIAMLYQGRIVATGTPDEIRSSQNQLVRQFITGDSEGGAYQVR
ncbi:MAG: ABC transporter ATP-binding protein [Nitrospirota bacterium]|nr:ABC transporter ATP-binding protein [Nitrospirota bacterium]